MEWLQYTSYVLGGAFLTNAVPHFVSGVMGRPFQSPFAKPPGKGLSSSTVNVLWGFLNAVVGYLLIYRMPKLRSALGGRRRCFGIGRSSDGHHAGAHVWPTARRHPPEGARAVAMPFQRAFPRPALANCFAGDAGP
jgi:hypothetical protein